MSETIINNKEGVRYITFKSLEKIPFITHGFSTRIGGVSKEHLGSLNLGLSRGDSYENVIENYRRFGNAVGFDYTRAVAGDQTHTKNIRIITEKDIGNGILKEEQYLNIDGLITNQKNIPLITYYADCVPLYIVDPVNKAIGLSHSGWRGTYDKIGMETIQAMNKAYGTKAKEVIVVIGPCICGHCYEVDADLIRKFEGLFQERYWESFREYRDENKGFLDLQAINAIIFEQSGVPKEAIHLADTCTCCNHQWLYSHRASKGKRGSLAAVLMIR